MIIKEYFQDIELECPCCNSLPKKYAVERLYALRIMYAAPIRITSGKRCPKHNKKVGGAKFSKHLEGIAFDCKVYKGDELEFITMARACGFYGIGFNPGRFIHIDTRPEDTIWGY